MIIDGRTVAIERGDTILTAARRAGIRIPTLCESGYTHPSGSCGMCVVEAKGTPKLLRACATQARDEMAITTVSPRVDRARREVLTLLSNEHRGDCVAPCVLACPGETDCQGYVSLIASGKTEEAVRLVREKLPLPASIGRVCPHPCETACRRALVEEPIRIAHLKRYMADTVAKTPADGALFLPVGAKNGKRVAVIGAGPAGLTATYFLTRKGYDVTIYEAMDEAGGMMRYGIPAFRLPRAVLGREVEQILRDAEIHYGVHVDAAKFLKLKRDYDAVFVAIGAWHATSARAKDEEGASTIPGIAFLRAVATGEAPDLTGKTVLVVGGGNTAMDAVRTAVRLGAKSHLYYRRTRNEMPADAEEIRAAEDEGVVFHFLRTPVAVHRDGEFAVTFDIMELGEQDASGRGRPVPTGERERVLADLFIPCIGQAPDVGDLTLPMTKWKTVATDNFYAGNNVFAAGDCEGDGAGIAIAAIGDARRAVRHIDAFLSGHAYDAPALRRFERAMTHADIDAEIEHSVALPVRAGNVRIRDFTEERGYTDDEARREAMRCLACGCHDLHECKLYGEINRHALDPVSMRAAETKLESRYLSHDPAKCILCGLCVTTCRDRVHNGAITMAGRGMETRVSTVMGESLADSVCIECGNCAAVCPTGAWQDRMPLPKTFVPRGRRIASYCTLCSVHCPTYEEWYGDLRVRILPRGTERGGLLCARGRFEILARPALTDDMLARFKDAKTLLVGRGFTGYECEKIRVFAKAHGIRTAPLEAPGNAHGVEKLFTADEFHCEQDLAEYPVFEMLYKTRLEEGARESADGMTIEEGGEIELGLWDEPWDMPYGTDGTPLRPEDL